MSETTTRGSSGRERSGPAAVVEPGLRQLLAGLTAVRDGDFGTRLPDEADGLMGEISRVFNGMVDQLSLFTSEVTRVAREVGTEGTLGGQAAVPGVFGTWADLTDSVNAMAGNLTTQVRDIAHVATAVAKGDLSQKIDVDARGEILELKNTINTMVDQLSAFADEVTRMARDVGTEGILGGQADVKGVSGTWRDLTDSVNSMAGNLTAQVRAIAHVATAVAGGDLSKKVDVDARGEILELKTTINTMVDQLSSFAAEVTRVAREVGTEGRLGGQARVPNVAGTWKDLTENVNELAGNLTRQVRAIAEVASAVAEGDLTRSITVEASGEVAELKDNINAMVGSLRETTRANQEQDWLKSSLARMSALMQGHRDLAVVAELVMDELTPLVGAQYGAFYLAEEGAGGVELGLVGSYGRPAGDRDRVRFRLGESLVGQAARSRRTVTAENVPEDYVTISSGLGSTSRGSLVVLPVVVEEQVLGVIELMSFSPFTSVHRDFLEQLMETVGVNLSTIVANVRTDELLDESQRLAGELRSRTEELQARQEELQRSNAELEEKAALLATQNRDIEAKNLQIEQARQELEDRAQQLDLASTYKSEFLANMSHELRTPLNSLLILAQLLAQNPTRNLTAKQVEYAGIIHSAGSDLLQLINDILDLSKVEAGKMDLNPERVPLRRLLDYVEATFRPLTSHKSLAFTVSTAAGVPVDLVTDDTRLRQVLRNLLSNAVKFTEHGSVELRIEPASDDELPVSVHRGGPVVAFRVTDTGIGIAPENLEAIFGAFQQADGTTNRKYGGTGLGLSISREIAHLLGAALTVTSVPGEGSTFTLYLPVARTDFAEQPAPDALPANSPAGLAVPAPARGGALALPGGAAARPPRRLLVIEERPRGLLAVVAENAVGRLSADGGQTGRSDIELVAVVGPQEAAAALATQSFHCVVLDVDMADGDALRFLDAMDGDEALRAVPVLAHNNRRLPADEEGALQDLARSRPLELLSSLDELRERIALHLSAEQPGDVVPLVRGDHWAPAPRAVDSTLSGRTVLAVDDDARNLYALSGILELHGITVLHAENGRKGIETLLANPAVSLVLMDVMMPEMDGYTATARIRELPQYADLPVIAVTAKAMPGDREKSLASGASDHVTKPVDADELIACVRRWLDGGTAS
ncbi:HAMP domain-containing protein [Streptomyces sp. NPDC004267]|uniref:HAMP domain-containing protein n=1 Tax=Streptomyces sp. NPDC004267 TaxID=3364694 RepID=UPI0036BAA3F4